jgi:hypothetical protein
MNIPAQPLLRSSLGPSDLKNFTLPRVKLCHIMNALDIMKLIRFERLEKLQLQAFGPFHRPLSLQSIPTTLTELAIREVSLSSKSLQARKPCRFPSLTTLKITNAVIEGHFQDYFILPKLKNLYLTELLYINAPQDQCPIPRDWQIEHLTLQKLPVQSIVLQRMRAWPKLQSLRFIQADLGLFIDFFHEYVGDKNSFRALKSLHIEDSWSPWCEWSYESFVGMCATERPGLEISGNGNEYDEDHDSEPSYDEDTELF